MVLSEKSIISQKIEIIGRQPYMRGSSAEDNTQAESLPRLSYPVSVRYSEEGGDAEGKMVSSLKKSLWKRMASPNGNMIMK